MDNLIKEISNGLFASVADMITVVKDSSVELLEILMKPVYELPLEDPFEADEQRRRNSVKLK
ncbi:hypothetical protein [Pedobacter chinensis]|nr:hypothetical protein [Pedobacter chinensis]